MGDLIDRKKVLSQAEVVIDEDGNMIECVRVKNIIDAQGYAPDKNVATNDLISRQAVIDLYEKYHPYLATKVYEFGQELRKLPSVSPELVNDSQDLVKQLESLESEYNAYHLDKNDYWRGVKHAIEVLKFRQA